jgi:hypothetical protein
LINVELRKSERKGLLAVSMEWRRDTEEKSGNQELRKRNEGSRISTTMDGPLLGGTA